LKIDQLLSGLELVIKILTGYVDD